MKDSRIWPLPSKVALHMGVCCLVWPLISCCGPQTQSQSAPGPHLPVSVGSTPAPSSAHSARTLVHVHILPLLFSCVGVGDEVLVMRCWFMAHVRLPVLCPAALLPVPHHAGVVKDWTAHPVRPQSPVPSPPPLQPGNLARRRHQPSTSSLQPDRIVLHPQGSASSDYKQTGGIHQLQPGPALLLGAGISAPQSALPRVTGIPAHPCPQSDSHSNRICWRLTSYQTYKLLLVNT